MVIQNREEYRKTQAQLLNVTPNTRLAIFPVPWCSLGTETRKALLSSNDREITLSFVAAEYNTNFKMYALSSNVPSKEQRVVLTLAYSCPWFWRYQMFCSSLAFLP